MSNLIAVGYSDVLDDLYKYHNSNAAPGLNVGYDCLNKLYTHKDAGVTDWTGAPGSGKTYFCLQVLLNLSLRHKKRHVIFVPDIGSKTEVFSKLIKMYTGKDMTDKYGNKINEGEIAKALTFLHVHFIVVVKQDFRKGVTPIEFWEFVCQYSDVNGPAHTGLIDSWKNMTHNFNGREDTYLDEVLAIRNEMSEMYNKHFHTIAHAVKTELSGQKGDSKRRVPTAWDIKGGASWYANGKNIITIDFPNKQDTVVNIYVSKVKPEDVGRPGQIVGKMKLDQRKGQYYEVMFDHNFFAYAWEDRPKDGEFDFMDAPSKVNSTTVPIEDLPF